VDKADEYEQVLEFARVQKAGDPYGFRFEEQEYWLRQKGGGVKTARFPWNEQLMADLQALAREEPDPEVARRLGEQLRRFLDELDWGGYELALRGRRAPRLVVRSAAAELYALPWELVTVEGSGQHLVDLPGSSLRYEWPGERERQEAGAAVQEGRVLLAWSAAGGRVPMEGHLRALEQASQQGDFSFDGQRDVLGRVSLRSLEQRLKSSREPVSVLHVLCHGSAVEASASRLYGLAWNAPREGDGVEVVDGGRLAAVLAPYADTLRMVVLCACHGGDGGKLASHLGSVAQALHRVGIEMVVASRLPLSVEGSVLLAETLYEQLLGESSSLEEAIGAARRRLRVEGRGLDWASLQLYARGDGDADSRPVALRPYRGLLAFEPKHQRFFFGRGRLREVLLERVRQAARGSGPRWQVVAGASGTGKSSMVLAGVVPLLAQEEWGWRVVRPGELVRAEGQAGSGRSRAVSGLLRRLQPLGSSEPVPTDLGATPEALVEAVRRLSPSRPERKLLLVVDQLEEIFTQLGSEDRQALMRALWRLAREPELGCVVVATLRTDHLERCGEVMLEDGVRLDAAMNSEQHRIFVTRMGPEELAEVIEQPAHRVGMELEPGLMDRLRKDVEPEPGGLPLLEHALDLLWQRRQGQRLTHSAYEELGGVAGALTQMAERQYEELSERERQQTRRLLVRLATLRELSGARAQGRAWVEELRPREGQERESFDAVVEKLVGSRLLVTGGQEEGVAGRASWVQLAHELLPRRWKRLGQWVEEGWERERQLREQEERRRQEEERERLRKEAEAQAAERRRQEEERERLRREAETPRAPQAQQSATKGTECILLAEQFRAKEPARAALFLREVSHEARNQRWMSTAMEVLQQPVTRVVLRGHGGAVRKVAFSPDGQRVVTASADKTARVWSTEGKLLATLQAHSQEVLAVAFSPDGQRVVTASMDGTAWVWSTDGRPLAMLAGHAHQVNTAVFSPDGLRVVTASLDKTARVWSLDGRLRATLEGHTGGVQMAAFSPDGQQVVTASLDKTARVWSTQGDLRTTLAGHAGWVNSAVFSPDGQQVVTASQDATAQIWKVDGEPLAALTGHGIGAENSTGLAGVLTAVFSPDGKRVVTASQDGTARVWEISSGRFAQVSGRPSWRMFARLAGHTSWVFSAEFSPDGQRVVTISEDGTARVWDVKEALLQDRLLGTLVGHGKGVQSFAISPDSQHVVTASKDGTARIWRLEEAGVLATLAGHGNAVSWAAFSPDGKRVVTASHDEKARVWSAEGQLLATLQGHAHQVTMAAFSPDGQWVVTASLDGMARVWSANGEPRVTLSGHRGIVWSASFSPDGQRLVTASDDGTARVWSTQGELLVTLQGSIRGMPSAAFSPDGQRVVTASMDGTVQVWSASGELLSTLQGHKSGVLRAAFSPDGKRVVTASMDGTARVWSGEGQLLATLEGHGTEQVSSAAFSPDGQWVVTASRDKTARMWSAGGRLLATLRHRAWVGSAAFSVDGERLVTACSDGKARVWPVSVKRLGEYLEAATRDCLSPKERQQYLDEPPEQARAAYERCEIAAGREP
jgi:WD40 repeat protein